MRILHILLLLSSLSCVRLSAQDFMMQAWYWDYPKGAWADSIAAKATTLAAAGFTSVWFPPHAAAASGPTSNGYDPKDLFIGTSTTGLGTLAQIVNMTNTLFNAGITPVADMVYNHRDGGAPEVNVSVEGWIENYNSTKVNQGDLPYPSDRFHCILPLGGTTGNGVGIYYIKIRSASRHPVFYNRPYKIYVQTNKVGRQNQPAGSEVEPNAGLGCGEPNNTITLGRDFNANIDALGCGFDEFALTLTAADFFPTDSLFIFLNNTAPSGISGYSDHYVVELWYQNGSTTTNIQSQIKYRTWTNHGQHSSGRGHMNGFNFRPNGNPTTLNGDKDGMWFFYDYDHSVPSTRDTLNAYTLWNWDYLKVRGVRMDAVKHFDGSYVGNMMNFMSSRGKNFNIAVGEIYSTSISEYIDWLNEVGNSSVRVFDFSLRENLRKACDDSGFDVRNVYLGGAANNGISPFQVVTFVNNHDFRDPSGFASLIKDNSELAYAYILTNNRLGLPCVFYPDYYGYPNNGYNYYPNSLAGKKATVDSLITLHKTHIVGATQVYYLNNFSAPAANYSSGSASKSLIYQLEKGNSDVLVAINFGYTPLTVTINLAGIPAGTLFSKVGGAASATSTFTTSGITATFTVPPRSYAAWRQGFTPLPVELLDFQASASDTYTALISWQIEQPSPDFLGFQLERSSDGGSFEHIATMGYKDDIRLYTYNDTRPTHQNKLYYRLKLVDRDGSSSHSPVRIVEWRGPKIKLTVAPNPVIDQTNLAIEAPSEADYLLSILDQEGRLLQWKQLSGTKGTSVHPISLEELKSGLYLLVVEEQTTGERYTHPIVVK